MLSSEEAAAPAQSLSPALDRWTVVTSLLTSHQPLQPRHLKRTLRTSTTGASSSSQFWSASTPRCWRGWWPGTRAVKEVDVKLGRLFAKIIIDRRFCIAKILKAACPGRDILWALWIFEKVRWQLYQALAPPGAGARVRAQHPARPLPLGLRQRLRARQLREVFPVPVVTLLRHPQLCDALGASVHLCRHLRWRGGQVIEDPGFQRSARRPGCQFRLNIYLL